MLLQDMHCSGHNTEELRDSNLQNDLVLDIQKVMWDKQVQIPLQKDFSPELEQYECLRFDTQSLILSLTNPLAASSQPTKLSSSISGLVA